MTRIATAVEIEQVPEVEIQNAPPVENLIEKESPKLTKMHEATNAIVDSMLKRDPKKFQELARVQQSGQ